MIKRHLFWLLPISLLIVSTLLAIDVMRFVSKPLQLQHAHHDYIVSPGTSMNKLSADLRALGLLKQSRDGLYLRIYARWSGLATNIQAGEYRIVANNTPIHLLQRMVNGDVLYHQIQFIEGWTFKQMMQAIAENNILEKTLDAEQAASIMFDLNPEFKNSEGLFFPDTYNFKRGTTDKDILKRAHKTMIRYLDQAWKKRGHHLPYKNKYQALVAASLIEKETGLAQERPKIAGVLVRRLVKRMRLQFDPTVIYGLGDAFDGNLTRAHLRMDNPYNTYRNYGLPPTPIAMPSAASIDAALHPDSGNELYFVAKGDGSHIFSATNTAHQLAVRRHQLN